MKRTVHFFRSTVYSLQPTTKQKTVVGSRKTVDNSRGFTLIEAIITIGLAAILSTIGVIALSRPQAQASVATITDTLVSDIKQQQLRSMSGDSGTQALAAAQGIRVESQRYTLFTGNVFTGSTDHHVINLPQGLSLGGVSLPLDIVFIKRSGETSPVSNLRIQNTAGDQKTLSINRLGAITLN